MRSIPVSASAFKPSSGSPRRTARPATCASDFSPVTYKPGNVGAINATACNSRVDLPMPGSPPTSTTAPSTRPPPSTRSNSPIPVDTRASSLWRTSFSAVTFGASILPIQPSRRALPAAFTEAAGSTTNSLNVFHAPHSPHWPCHLLWSAPHSLQTYAVWAFAEILAIEDAVGGFRTTVAACDRRRRDRKASRSGAGSRLGDAAVAGFALRAPLQDFFGLGIGGDTMLQR